MNVGGFQKKLIFQRLLSETKVFLVKSSPLKSFQKKRGLLNCTSLNDGQKNANVWRCARFDE